MRLSCRVAVEITIKKLVAIKSALVYLDSLKTSHAFKKTSGAQHLSFLPLCLPNVEVCISNVSTRGDRSNSEYYSPDGVTVTLLLNRCTVVIIRLVGVAGSKEIRQFWRNTKTGNKISVGAGTQGRLANLLF